MIFKDECKQFKGVFNSITENQGKLVLCNAIHQFKLMKRPFVTFGILLDFMQAIA